MRWMNLAGDEGKLWHPSGSPFTNAYRTPHHLRTLEGMVVTVMGLPVKVLFYFELDHTHSWSPWLVRALAQQL